MDAAWRRKALVLMTLLGMAALVACDTFGPQEPQGAGDIFVDLQSPNGDEGAAVFEIEDGSGLGEVTSGSGWIFQERVGEGIRVVVLMPIPGPIHFKIRADDVGRLPTVSVVQVAGPENQLRESLAEYEVALFEMVERGAR